MVLKGFGAPSRSLDGMDPKTFHFPNKKAMVLKGFGAPGRSLDGLNPQTCHFLIKNDGFERIWRSRPLLGRPGPQNVSFSDC